MKRAELTGFIQGRIDAIQEAHRFDPMNGFAQIDGETDLHKIRHYGEFSALCDIVERFELAVNLDPPQLPEAKAAFQESRRLLESV